MTTTIQKEWGAVQDDKILVTENFRQDVVRELHKRGLDTDDFEIVALPKPHWSMII